MSEKKKENRKRSKNKRKVKRNGIQRKRLNDKLVEFRDKKIKRSYMKPYFAKYLPTEGKVKDNSLVLDKDRNKVGHITYPDNADGIYDIQFLDGTNGGSDHFTLVKLMLCSRNILVGNMCYWDDGVWDNYIGGEIVYGNPIPVIGEISPAAIWVKEGDEFDEDEIKITEQCPHYEGKHMWKECSCKSGFVKGVYIKDSEGNFH